MRYCNGSATGDVISNLSPQPGEQLLIFIDEIQNSPVAVSLLRYFYEEYPDIHVIAAEHIVGQQLLASRTIPQNQLLFWVREKPQATSEVDYVIPRGNHLIPIEVKSGKTGTLRSLHSFIDHSENNLFAIRLYSGKIAEEKINSIEGKTFQLLNLPYYLSGQLARYIPDEF